MRQMLEESNGAALLQSHEASLKIYFVLFVVASIFFIREGAVKKATAFRVNPECLFWSPTPVSLPPPFHVAYTFITQANVVAACGKAMKKRHNRYPDPQDAKDYFDLVLNAAGTTVTLRDGRTLNERELCLETLRNDPTHAAAYFFLALSALRSGETILLPDGRSLGQKELYLEVLHHDPTRAGAYFQLALLLNRRETVTLLNGRIMQRAELLAEAYFRFAEMGSRLNDKIALPDGREMTASELYLEALREKPTHAASLAQLAGIIQDGESVTLVGGRSFGKAELYLDALRYDPTCVAAYLWLAGSLKGRARLVLPDGRDMGKQELYLEVLRIDRNSAKAYFNLALGLQGGAKLSLPDGRELGKQQLYLEALRCDATCVDAYVNLASMLRGTETVSMPDGRELGKQELYVQASQYSRAKQGPSSKRSK